MCLQNNTPICIIHSHHNIIKIDWSMQIQIKSERGDQVILNLFLNFDFVRVVFYTYLSIFQSVEDMNKFYDLILLGSACIRIQRMSTSIYVNDIVFLIFYQLALLISFTIITMSYTRLAIYSPTFFYWTNLASWPSLVANISFNTRGYVFAIINYYFI